eukprot:311389-Chlamydomonas_euryale.AAC.4
MACSLQEACPLCKWHAFSASCILSASGMPSLQVACPLQFEAAHLQVLTSPPFSSSTLPHPHHPVHIYGPHSTPCPGGAPRAPSDRRLWVAAAPVGAPEIPVPGHVARQPDRAPPL